MMKNPTVSAYMANESGEPVKLTQVREAVSALTPLQDGECSSALLGSTVLVNVRVAGVFVSLAVDTRTLFQSE